MTESRPVGMSSRLWRAPGPRTSWVSTDGQTVEFPLLFDLMQVERVGEEPVLRVDATVDVVDGEPVLVSVTVRARTGLDIARLQQFFRWATPLEAITTTVPQLLALGRDPFAHDYAVSGYPDAAEVVRRPHRRLTDGFLEEVAQRYLSIGRGYAKAIAAEYRVSPRTAVSWIEKARARGILAPTTPGSLGGRDDTDLHGEGDDAGDTSTVTLDGDQVVDQTAVGIQDFDGDRRK